MGATAYAPPVDEAEIIDDGGYASATALFAEAVYEAELDDAIQAAEALIANATGINRTASSSGTASTSDNSTSKQATEVASDGAAPEGMRESALVIAEDSIRRGNVQTCLGLLYDVRLAMVAGGLVGANASVRSTYNLPAILAEPSKTPYMFAGVASHSEWENFVLIAHPYLPTGFSFGEVFASSSETWGEWYGAGTTFDRWIAQGLSFGLYDGTIYDDYGYFSVSLGFHPDSPRRDYLIMILSDPTHRLLYETRAPVIVGCTLN